MSLPSFIVIGGERCGSTWLYLLLKSHPQVYVPSQRKEINFFNWYYDKGIEWYESFFPSYESAQKYHAIGEVSPLYLNQPVCVQRMSTIKSINKLIVILRNPVDRVYSLYGHLVRLLGYRKSFEDFLVDYPDAIDNSFYAKRLEFFLPNYPREKIKCLIFEEAVNNVFTVKKELANFLNLDVSNFPDYAGELKANPTYIPKYKIINKIASYATLTLRDLDLDLVVNLANKIGAKNLLKLGATEEIPPMSKETRLYLQNIFAKDINQLESMLNMSFDIWYH